MDEGPAKVVLGPMLRFVGPDEATIWVETSAAADVAVELVAEEPSPAETVRAATRTFGVAGHHYALVIVRGLTPATIYRYTMQVDGQVCWPDRSGMPPSYVRTLGTGRADGAGAGVLRVMFGSCRAAAPHEPPWTLEPRHGSPGRGVDALRTHALRMMSQPREQWPDLLVLVGDQVYADDTSPGARARIEARRPGSGLPASVVADFEEYTMLYRESWSPPVERWFFANVPSAMIFDDHDMVDDWNISDAWRRDVRAQPWWREHVLGGLGSYLVYQHLGNLSPAELDASGLLEKLSGEEDATEQLRAWAEDAVDHPTAHRFSAVRDLGDVRVVTIDCRTRRVLDEGARAMVDDDEWAWVVAQAMRPCRHLLLVTSLPVFVPGGLHGLQAWNEAVCAGAWGRLAARLGERLRRALDLEDWAAFGASFDRMVDLLATAGAAARADADPPDTITVLSGDIHCSYHAPVTVAGAEVAARCHQVVSSPIRNALRPAERRVMLVATSRAGRRIGAWLRRRAGGRAPGASWALDQGLYFDNGIGALTLHERGATLVLERAKSDDQGRPVLEEVARAVL